MSIRQWPTEQRPREKLIQYGATSLSDAELLAIFLRTGCHGQNAIELAQNLLNHFKSISALLHADLEDVEQINGLGVAKYCQLQAVLELSSRYFEQQLKQAKSLNNSTEIKQLCISKLSKLEHERFDIVLLNNQHQLLRYHSLFHGSISQSAIYPREVVKLALKHNSAAVIFAHNHPSGSLIASEADQQITQRLIKSLELVDIRVLDHIIISRQQAISMAEQGFL